MKSCIRVPRVFLPRDNLETWAVPACDSHAYDRNFWERVAQATGGAPSALSCILPDVYLGDEDEARRKEVCESMYAHLESGVLERLNRGMIYVERETKYGQRRGIVANVDLEEFSPEGGKGAMICAAEETLPELVEARCALRRQAVMEFPHAVLLYRDKKDKVLRALAPDLEELYNITLFGGDRIRACFIPDEESQYVAQDLLARADPCFVVADGTHSLAAAKKHWEEIKQPLSDGERRNHPARFFLAEFVNVFEEGLALEPVHRVVKEIETEAFCEYFRQNVKCKREGRVLYPILAGEEGYRQTERTIREFVRQNYGKIEYQTGRPQELAGEDGAVVALPAVEKEELFAAVKNGRRFPAKTFCLGAESARYSIEGREISYD